jgi:hypothetical protein
MWPSGRGLIQTSVQAGGMTSDLWGVDLGQGWTTSVEFAGYYVIVVLALNQADPFASALTLGAFGIGRALPVVVAGLVASKADLFAVTSCYVARRDRIAQANAVALAVLAGYLAAYWR